MTNVGANGDAWKSSADNPLNEAQNNPFPRLRVLEHVFSFESTSKQKHKYDTR